MKLKSILREDGAMLTFNGLSSLQKSLLRKMTTPRQVEIAPGKFRSKTEFDLNNATPKEWAIMTSLQDLGLVDDRYDLTPVGQKAAQLTRDNRSLDVKHAAVRDQKLGRTGGMPQRYTGTDDGDEEVDSVEPGRFQDQWGAVRDRDD